MNVLLSSLIKRRWPERAGFLIGLYITALSVGAITGSVVAVPLWDRTGGSVGLTLGWLAAPAALAVLLWLPQAGHATRTGRSATGARPAGPAIPDDIAAIPGDIPVLFDDTPAVPGDVPAASDARAAGIAAPPRSPPRPRDRASADAAPPRAPRRRAAGTASRCTGTRSPGT